jgi:hypothetical protein
MGGDVSATSRGGGGRGLAADRGGGPTACGYLRVRRCRVNDFDDQADEIHVVSARMLYDGSIAVMLVIPGNEELVEHILPGDT